MKKTLIVVGASGALGTGVTKVLMEKKFDSYILPGVNRDEDWGENVITTSKVDFSLENGTARFFEDISPSKDRLFFLFCAVGGFTGGKPLQEHSQSELELMVNMNTQVPFLILKYFTRVVAESAGGSAVFTSAMTGGAATANSSVYGASKAALNYLIKTAAIEGRGINLSVNGFAPNLIQTPQNLEWAGKAEFNKMQNPEEIGELVYQLFRNFHMVSGNIIELPLRFSDVNF